LKKKISAILGPTNTGKTYEAIKRLLGYSNGVIGFPLRLLARENYEFTKEIVGKEKVAIAFKTQKVPKYFFIQVDKNPSFRARKNLFKSIFTNNEGVVVKGKNILSFQKGASGETLEGLVSKHLFLRNSRVTVTVSLSHDGKNWGPLYKKHLKKWDRKRVWDRWRRGED